MSKIINILTAKLNYETANLIYNEYQNRLSEANYLIDNYDYYKSLRKNKEVLEALLALSIFYKRLIANFDGFLDFSNTLYRSQVYNVSVGKNQFKKEDTRKLYFLTKDFYELMKKFSFTPFLFDYSETKDFLNNLLDYKLK